MPIRKTVISTGAMNTLNEMRQLFSSDVSDSNIVPSDESDAGGRDAGGRRQAPFPRRRAASALVDADADDHVADLFDVARLGLDLLRGRVRPLVVDPALALAVGEIEDLLDEGL